MACAHRKVLEKFWIRGLMPPTYLIHLFSSIWNCRRANETQWWVTLTSLIAQRTTKSVCWTRRDHPCFSLIFLLMPSGEWGASISRRDFHRPQGWREARSLLTLRRRPVSLYVKALLPRIKIVQRGEC